LFTLQFSLCLLLASPAAASDALWQRAVAISAYNRDVVPGSWVERKEVFNGEGESHLVSRTHVGFKQIGSKVDVFLVEATTNGEDITLQLQEVFEEKQKDFSLKPQYNPFLPGNQKDISAKREGRSRRDGEVTHIAYDYTQKSPDGRWRGLVWIDETTGMPLEATARLTGLPKKDGKDEIKEVVLNVTFENGPEQRWYPSRITIFNRSILNDFPYSKFYATIETSITFDKYWQITFH
jgi:hypothetical protein